MKKSIVNISLQNTIKGKSKNKCFKNLIVGRSASRTLQISFSLSVTGALIDPTLWKNLICNIWTEINANRKRFFFLFRWREEEITRKKRKINPKSENKELNKMNRLGETGTNSKGFFYYRICLIRF